MNRTILVLLCLVVVIECCGNHGGGKKKLKRGPLGELEDTKNISQLIEANGYPWTQHTAFTHDGYHLGLFRIPNPGKPPVLLQHGLLDSATSFVISSKTASLGYILHDAGYDVFLCNHRGNKYSQKHEVYSPKSPEFWDFSWDQHASGDIPACINTVLQLSQSQQLYYIGHSQGATAALAEFSRLPSTWAHKVKLFIALAPIVFLNHEESALLRVLTNTRLDDRLKALSEGEFTLNSQTASFYLAKECAVTPSLCNNLLSSLMGDSDLLEKSHKNFIMDYWPDTTSRQNMIHWIQNARSGNFGDYNGTVYDVSQVQIPVAVFCGSSDALGL